jgi:hypothetical protein
MPDHNDRFDDPSESVDNSPADAGQSPTAPKKQAAPQLSEAPQLDKEPQPLDQFSDQKQSQPPWVWAGMGVLVLLALFVIFVLPGIVEDYELPLERRVEESLAVAPVPTAQRTEPGVSPFLEAQRARERKEAQDVLAELLSVQSELDELQVTRWAQTDYDAALALALQGDESYRVQEFGSARDDYQQALAQLTETKTSVPTVLEQMLISGEQALIAREADEAIAAFELAVVLEDSLVDLVDGESNKEAQIGLTRALALEELIALLDSAERAAGNPTQQVSLLEQAVELDPYSVEAQQALAQARADQQQARFAAMMSEGYAQLQAGNPQEAIARFEAAATLGVNENEARAAIVQTETEIANAKIAELQQRAQTAEANEAWQEAVVDYQAIVAIDATLPAINRALDYAEKRARLDALLIAALDSPERFAEQAVFEETRDIYFTGRAIETPGPRLTSQLDELQVLLENSQVPVSIRFISDGLTEVTLLRVSDLGTFEQTRVDLKPGTYAAVGRRAGYREVREEFTVGFGLTPAVVIVRCSEAISSALGR